MKIIKSAKGNSYLFDERNKYVQYIPKDYLGYLDDALDIPVKSEIKQQVDFLKAHHLLEKEPPNNAFRLLTEKDIDEALCNTRQIIFEVTDNCNLQCYYCGYGNLYNNYDPRINKKLNFKLFLSLYSYMRVLWGEHNNIGNNKLRISFYGGEPLLNFSFIQKVVDYISCNPISGKYISYSMTTNGLLLNQYIDYLVQHKFDILVSIDGNKNNNSYRKYKNGRSSFNDVIKNLDYIQNKHPLYFDTHVNFNSVLHDRNSVEETSVFLFSKYKKYPMTNELNIFGVVPERRKEFATMFRSKMEDYRKILNKRVKAAIDKDSPKIVRYEKILFSTKLFCYNVDFNRIMSEDYICDSTEGYMLPTKTCIPFSRKIFVSVQGKIYPCERIGNEINYGNVDEISVHIDKKGIVEKYNLLFAKYVGLCQKCKMIDTCSVCIASDIEGNEICKKNNNIAPHIWEELISYFEEYPEKCNEIIKNVSMI